MTTPDLLSHDADVLVLGGGPSATWAAISAAESGSRVVLADKGYCGTSGATASGGTNLWSIPPHGSARKRAVRDGELAGGRITDYEWMFRVLETSWERVEQLAGWGYPFATGPDGRPLRSSLQGPEYMRRMRRKAHRSGVLILDHHPALELLTDADGVVAGAAGIARQDGGRPWRVTAGAVVLATGGTAFLSGSFGTNVNTGDGLLFGAEVGADLSGMEFATAYALAPEWGLHTKGRMLQWGSFYDEHGEPITAPGNRTGRQAAQWALTQGIRVFARVDRVPDQARALMRTAQPNYFLPLDKAGIDPFTTAYPIRMVHEGTVRGTGGLRIVDTRCATTVPGLFAAGDVATRELIAGAVSGGGSRNASWAITSGTLAGRGASEFARSLAGRAHRRVTVDEARLGLRDAVTSDAPRVDDVVRAVQSHILPPQRSYLKSAARLQESATALDTVWRDLAGGLAPVAPRERYKTRQAVALTAAARWSTAASLARTETRGMHRREDRPHLDERMTHRLLVGGLDTVWTAPDPVAPRLLRDEIDEVSA
ncbi:FAD-binding protein [Mycobacterium sp. pV006]|uniref:FAD-binding protein n=1 Tax=Mycobacterium sp. pV006 TaxID=3238983 RepID=UPI00351B2726